MLEAVDVLDAFDPVDVLDAFGPVDVPDALDALDTPTEKARSKFRKPRAAKTREFQPLPHSLWRT